MRISLRNAVLFVAILFVGVFVFCYNAPAQSSSGTIQGVVKDPTGAVVAGAKVEISNPVSGFHRETVAGGGGDFRFTNIPFNPYHLVITAKTFAPYTQDVDVRSGVPVVLDVPLALAGASTTVDVSAAGNLLEVDSTPHADLDRALFDKIALDKVSGLSSLVTQMSSNAVADSDGLVHGLSDHAENSVSLDGQANTDQQSKVFSNQFPVDAIQSMEVISGAPPAEYRGKTSLVVKVTTRSGLGQAKPTGNFTTSYGSFGPVTAGGNFAIGGGHRRDIHSARG